MSPLSSVTDWFSVFICNNANRDRVELLANFGHHIKLISMSENGEPGP